MSDKHDFEEIYLPDDLGALDEELSSIRYEERPSFGPELRAELARAWAEQPRRRPAAFRHLAAAAVGGLLIGTVAVPSARASLVRLFGVLSSDAAIPEAPTIIDLPPPPLPAVEEPVEEVEEAIAPLPQAPPAIVLDEDLVVAEAPTLPQMLDRERAQAEGRRAYPEYLQRQGVGGQVWLRVWVDTYGMTSLATVARSSGISDLDRAALGVAPLIRFSPAMQNGAPISTWIEFPVTFEPDPDDLASTVLDDDPMRLPALAPGDAWQYETPLDLRALDPSDVSREGGLTGPESALVEAIGDPMVRRSLGPIESILSGIAPEGRPPIQWRTAATEVLEDAIERATDNPAPLLAMGRIRLRQGLKTDARLLFERGLQIAVQNQGSVSAATVAELHYERGRLISESWKAAGGVGRVRAEAFVGRNCPQAPATRQSPTGFASVDQLVAWNYLCPNVVEGVFESGFELGSDAVADLSLTMGSYRAAIAAVPGHPGANVELLMALAEADRWEDVLAGARRFARASGGHPHSLLLAGVALRELGRLEEAAAHLEAGLNRLSADEAESIRDVSFVTDGGDLGEYRRLWGEERRAWEADFWAAKDRTPGTPINEREIQHLARSTYALFRFGGVTSDPGEVWVRFGGPKSVHIVDAGSGQLTEFWDYGSDPDITFVRWVASQTMDLTPEGRAYVDDLGNIFPPQ